MLDALHVYDHIATPVLIFSVDVQHQLTSKAQCITSTTFYTTWHSHIALHSYTNEKNRTTEMTIVYTKRSTLWHASVQSLSDKLTFWEGYRVAVHPSLATNLPYILLGMWGGRSICRQHAIMRCIGLVVKSMHVHTARWTSGLHTIHEVHTHLHCCKAGNCRSRIVKLTIQRKVAEMQPLLSSVSPTIPLTISCPHNSESVCAPHAWMKSRRPPTVWACMHLLHN